MGTQKKWTGQWLCTWLADDHLGEPWNYWRIYRKELTLASKPRHARIRVTADSRYKLFVNGKFVCRGPARGYPFSLPYDELDIAPFLRAGRNVLAAVVHHFGITMFHHIETGWEGFLLDGEAELGPGKTVPLSTDSTWRTIEAGWCPGLIPARFPKSNVIRAWNRMADRISFQQGFQEDFDASQLDPNWMLPGFDDSKWTESPRSGPVPRMPWPGLEPRGISFLEEKEMAPSQVLSQWSVTTVKNWEKYNNLGLLLFHEKRQPAKQGAFRLGQAGPKNTMTFEILPAKDRKPQALLLDFGKEVVGHPRLAIQKALGGEMVDLFYTEDLNHDGSIVLLDPEESCRIAMADRYRCCQGKQEWEGFGSRGFRYMLVTVRRIKKPIVLSVSLTHSSYPVEARGSFSCSDPLLNKIWETAAHTQRVCMLDSYVDCPWREQGQWWGDATVQAWVTAYAFGKFDLLRRGIRQAAQSQTPEGLLFGVFPSQAYDCILPDFNLIWVMSLQYYFLFTGKKDVIEEVFPALEKCLDWFCRHAGEEKLLGPVPGTWLFLDWQPLIKDQYSAIFNFLYIAALRSAVDLAKLLGRLDRARQWKEQELAVTRTVLKRFFDPQAKVFREACDLKTKERSSQISQHSHTWAILLGFKPELHEHFCRDVILPGMRSLISGKDLVSATPYFYAYVLKALFQAGFATEAMDFIRKGWGMMLDKGTSTFWESWDAQPGISSLCHAWSSSPLYHLSQQVLGVQPLAPAWSKVRIAPKLLGLSWAKGKVPAGSGEIEVAWEVKKDNMVRLEISLPKGTKGILEWPGHKPVQLKHGKNRFDLNKVG